MLLRHLEFVPISPGDWLNRLDLQWPPTRLFGRGLVRMPLNATNVQQYNLPSLFPAYVALCRVHVYLVHIIFFELGIVFEAVSLTISSVLLHVYARQDTPAMLAGKSCRLRRPAAAASRLVCCHLIAKSVTSANCETTRPSLMPSSGGDR